MINNRIQDPAYQTDLFSPTPSHNSYKHRTTVLNLILMSILGALNTLAFAPSQHGGWLELVIFFCMFWLLSQTRTLCTALLAGGTFGFGQFVSGVWWLYISMHFYGHMPSLIAGTIVVLFALYLALYPAFSAGLWYMCYTLSRPWKTEVTLSWYASIAFACAWTLGEWLRGTLFTGFPWLASGYAQVNGPLAGFAPLIGVYGIGWILALVSALIVQTVIYIGSERGIAIWLMSGVIAAALLLSGELLSRITWTQQCGPRLSVRLLQGNIEQSSKFEPVSIRHAIALYQKLIMEKPADLIVMPETSIPLPPYEASPQFCKAIQHFSDTTHASVLFGTVGITMGSNKLKNFTNSLYGITPGSSIPYQYEKHHLVPFGEFVPWGFRWFVNMMNMPLGDFSRGSQTQPPFIVHKQLILPNICYEDIFGEEISCSLRKNSSQSSILVNSTNLGWFGNTIAQEHHLQIAQMRTLETGRPMLCATNTGVTAMINADGSIAAQLNRFTLNSLDACVQGRNGITPYIVTGNTPILIISLVGLAIRFWMVGRGDAYAHK
ncbi:apolipoprotein N-acyltransferase [Candidatus Vallotia tarda]|uniref:Apolipoprotein N-acyltransferase n=1 Tax=Candidatus Vallotiella hemipterorum TaxID=1177213 RepID=A0A916JRV8_9BURK|nr:apolipoprotein N-acyltransferase [Candidatus Vallotia tarda]CAG7597231.1 Apolipoprotein N-acyltransferase [Candidatus Vallotia tarda]